MIIFMFITWGLIYHKKHKAHKNEYKDQLIKNH